MGRVLTCQKNCNTIDLRRAQVNDLQWLDLVIGFDDISPSNYYQGPFLHTWFSFNLSMDK